MDAALNDQKKVFTNMWQYILLFISLLSLKRNLTMKKHLHYNYYYFFRKPKSRLSLTGDETFRFSDSKNFQWWTTQEIPSFSTCDQEVFHLGKDQKFQSKYFSSFKSSMDAVDTHLFGQKRCKNNSKTNLSGILSNSTSRRMPVLIMVFCYFSFIFYSLQSELILKKTPK